jgi:exonuclease III
VILGLAEHDLADVFRALHGYAAEGFSWLSQRPTEHQSRRYDHIFASAALRPVACRYHVEWRERGLSDHAPIEADFRPLARGPASAAPHRVRL